MWLLGNAFTPLAALLLYNVAAQTSPPEITLAPRSMNVADGGTVSFFCEASGSPAPSFHWRRNGRRVNSRFRRYEIFEAPHSSSLRIEPVRAGRDNDVTFACVADNGLGEVRETATLHVYEQNEIPPGFPRIVVHPRLRAVEKGRNAVMGCEASGDPEPHLTWLKDRMILDLTDPRLQLLDNGYLQIQDSQLSDEAMYECLAENSAGVAYSYPAMLYVRVRRVPPMFTEELEDVRVMRGSDVNLTCAAVGSPMPYVKWRQGAVDLTREDEIPIGRNVLQLRDVEESQNYTCVASSNLGRIEQTVQVIVQEGPA